MQSTEQIAKHLREVHFGANWTAVNLKDTLAGVTWRQAPTPVASFHSIATLVFHINYYIRATIEVLRGGSLDAKDALSFDSPPLSSVAFLGAGLEASLGQNVGGCGSIGIFD